MAFLYRRSVITAGFILVIVHRVYLPSKEITQKMDIIITVMLYFWYLLMFQVLSIKPLLSNTPCAYVEDIVFLY